MIDSRERTAENELCRLDRETLLLVDHVIEDMLDCLERWQKIGYDDWEWVTEYWARRVAPSIGVELPRQVRDATDAAGVHRGLLEWQDAIIAQLL